MVWVHCASSWPVGVALSAEAPEWTGLPTVVPEPLEQAQSESPFSNPGLATRLVVAAPAVTEPTAPMPAPITAAALTAASERLRAVGPGVAWRNSPGGRGGPDLRRIMLCSLPAERHGHDRRVGA